MTQTDKPDFDAVVVGAGPNGLASAILLQQHGKSVLLIEGKNEIGGGLSTRELTLPGFRHDVCSAVHPMAAASPFLQTLPLEDFGLEFIYPEINVAHPFDDGTAFSLRKSLTDTASQMGADQDNYLRLLAPVVNNWPAMAIDLLGPLQIPAHPLVIARFGMKALLPITSLAAGFHTVKARGFLAGIATHNIQPLANTATSAIALVMMANGHLKGWPIIKGGSQQLAIALAGYFISIGGKIETGTYIENLSQLPSSKAVLLDVTPRQLLTIAGQHFSAFYKWQLKRYRYGMGIFKIDWALDSPIPFIASECSKAGTLHLGNTLEEIVKGEFQTAKGEHQTKPFVLLSQPSLFDPCRAPEGKHTAYAYCHVPNGSMADMTAAIERQVERFAPGFREQIIGKSTMNTAQLQAFNPNLIGGDINGGTIDIRQLFTRPALRWSPYKTSARGIYICSSATPPGGGVHGMCGYQSAKRVLHEVFKIRVPYL